VLYPNGQLVFAASPRLTAGALAATGAAGYGGIRGARFNRYVSETFSPVVGGLPSGYGGRSALLPVRAGGLSSVVALSIAAAGAGVLGLPGDGAAAFTVSVSDAEGQLISSGSGAASFSLTASPLLLTASLGARGSASLAITTNTPTLGAEANLTGSAGMTFAGALTPYAIGNMIGSTVDGGTLTAASVASAVWTQAIEAGYTAEQVLRILAAHAAGAATGLEGGDPQFTGLDGTTVRINGTYSAGTRTIDAINAA
jgi:hypothetical protein